MDNYFIGTNVTSKIDDKFLLAQVLQAT